MSHATPAYADPLARASHRWSLALLGIVAFIALGLPILFAIAPALADAAGSGGRTALVASAILSLAVVAAFVHASARRAEASHARRLERRVMLAGGIATVLVLAIFPAQLSVFALAWPPPETAVQYFDLLQERPSVGLLSLDLLLMVDWIVLLAVWAGLYVALHRTAPRTMLLVVGLVLASTLTYFVSNTAFDMASLSAQHAAASTDAERAALVAQGEDALATFEGPWFTASYVLNGIGALLASIVMWRAPGFGKVVGGVGVAYGAMQLLPPNTGDVAMVVSLLSLLPMLVWLVLLARALVRLGRRAETPA